MGEAAKKTPTPNSNSAQYNATYYVTNRSAISEAKRNRYNTDPEYREAAKKRALERHKRMRNKRKSSAEVPAPSSLAHGARGYNKPRVMTIGGKPVLVHCVAEFADRIARNVQTITVWEQRRIIPQPTGVDELHRRWYSDAHINFVREVIAEFQKTGGRRLEDFKALVAKRWKEATASGG